MKKFMRYSLLTLLSAGLFSCGITRRMESRRPLEVTPEVQRLTVDLQTQPNVVKINHRVLVPARYVPRKAQVVYESYLIDSASCQSVAKIYLNGRTYQRLLWRQAAFEKWAPDLSDGMVFVSSNRPMTILSNATVPFEEWMSDADLEAITTVSECGVVSLLNRQVLARGVEYIPQIAAPIVVEVPPVVVAAPIILKEEGSASLTYAINSYQVNPSFGHNAAQIDAMTALLNKILGDSLCTVDRIVITGICSPDGLYASNLQLARNRAEAMKNYLVSRLKLSPDLIHLDAVAEDWDGLREAVDASSLGDKSAVLALIDSSLPPDAKSKAMLRLPSYWRIKTQMLPPLRRIQYSIFYTKELLRP
ncbi:MAG: OmpA family protein [Alistipes sp.]